MFFLLYTSIFLLILFFILNQNIFENFLLCSTYTRTNTCYSYTGEPCSVKDNQCS